MHMALAHQMYKAGSYKQALEHSNAVYERNPLRTDNLLLLGAIYYQVESLFQCSFVPFGTFSYLLFGIVGLSNISIYVYIPLQLHDYDMCIARNEEALRLEPRFAECYGNMANAWKVINALYVKSLRISVKWSSS